MPANRVTIFSNGIADFQRTWTVTRDRPAEISIPVRKDHIGDVLASLNVYGPVTLAAPPSFRPANEAEGALSFDPARVIEDLATNLSGSKVTITRASGAVDGRLVGLHSEPEATAGEPIQPKFVVLLTAEGLVRIPLRELSRLRFQDADVQKELDKALDRNVQRIKPHSTFVTLTLATQRDSAEAVLQYTLPAAAWKISYRLRRRPPDDGGDVEPFEFQGFAIVDNNTDEDWTDFRIAVVTGEPITFSTDLADTKIPRREHVNVVKSRALGSVAVEQADFLAAKAEHLGEAMMMAPAPSAGAAMRISKAKSARTESVDSYLMEFAETEEADVQTVGDFCVFESPAPVTIAARQSAVIPVFQSTLTQAKSILYHKHDSHPERPYRAIQFTNETDFSLGRGVCTVYDGGVYAGSCVLPALPAGDESMLPHALETGVRLRREQPQRVERVVGLRLSAGFCYTSRYEEQTTHYQIRSARDETFELVLDHDHVLPVFLPRKFKPGIAAVVQREDGQQSPLPVKDELKAGVRYSLPLNPREKLRVTITESRVAEARARLMSASGKELHPEWLETNLVHTNGPLAGDPGIRKCLELQTRLSAVQQKTAHAEQDHNRLAEKQDRLRKNIGAGGHSEQVNRWQADLGSAEDRITETDEQLLPQLRTEEQAIRDELRDALRSLSAEWKDETPATASADSPA